MNVRKLQFGKAISAALFVLLLSVAGMKNAFAQTQVATLQHADSISVFYGASALVVAYNAATTNDIITLSDGTFTGCNISKAITLRGAGCVWDSVSASFPTIVFGGLTLNVATSEDSHLTVEGIHFTGEVLYRNLNKPRFIKCNFDCFKQWGNPANSYDESHITYAQFVNCMIKSIQLPDQNGHFTAANTTFINCYVNYQTYYQQGIVNTYNSIFKSSYSNNKMTAYNSILICRLTDNSVAYNCIGIRPSSSNLVFDCQNFGCMTVNSYTDVFETFDGSEFSYLEKFLLKEEIATSFLGTDGTEVSIYGGIAPYTPRPSHMVVKHCNVANKSTVDGKLSVDIEVFTEDE